MSAAKDEIPLDGSFKNIISPTIQRALVDFWGNDDIIDQPEILVELGSVSVSRISRIGRKSLTEIARALDSLGYIDSSGSWLTEES